MLKEPADDSVEELQKRISDLRARLPRHSVPPAMLEELEELEEELERKTGPRGPAGG